MHYKKYWQLNILLVIKLHLPPFIATSWLETLYIRASVFWKANKTYRKCSWWLGPFPLHTALYFTLTVFVIFTHQPQIQSRSYREAQIEPEAPLITFETSPLRRLVSFACTCMCLCACVFLKTIMKKTKNHIVEKHKAPNRLSLCGFILTSQHFKTSDRLLSLT